MTKKRLYVLFAFLFAAVFALVCAFTLSACKDKDEEGDKTPEGTEEVLPEGDGDDGTEPGGETSGHTHNYVVDATTWAWTDETHTDATATATCSNDDGLCPEGEITVTVNATSVEAEDTATCEAAGTVTHTAYYGDDVVLTCEGEESPKKDHVWVIDETSWQWDFTNGPTASVLFNCTVGGESQTVTATGDAIALKEDVYTATVTGPDGKTYTGTYDITSSGDDDEPEGGETDGYIVNQTVDFSDPDSYWWIDFDSNGNVSEDKTYTNGGVISLAGKTSMKIDTTNGRLTAGGQADSSHGRYFTIDLSAYADQGYTVEIEISIRTSNSTVAEGASEATTTLYLTTNSSGSSTSGALATVTSYRTSEDGPVTLKYKEELTGANAILYTLSDANMHYYSLSVKVYGDTKSEGAGSEETYYTVTIKETETTVNVGETLQMTAAVAVNNVIDETLASQVTWKSSNEEVATIDEATGLLTAVAAGTTTITATYDPGNGTPESASVTIAVIAAGTGETDPNHVHSYEATFEWEYNDGVVVKATLTCQTNDGTTCDNGTVEITSGITYKTSSSDATCTQPATITYYDATFTYEGVPYTSDSDSCLTRETSAALGHQWKLDVNWTQNSDGTWTATSASRTCTRVTGSGDGDSDTICGETETTINVTVTSEESGNYIIYTATATFEDGSEMADTKEVENPAAVEKFYTIEITSTTSTVVEGATITLTAKVTEATDGEVHEAAIVWTIISGEEYIQLTQNEGAVQGLAVGTALVRATYTDENGDGASIDVYVVVASATDYYPDYTAAIDFTDLSDAEKQAFGNGGTIVIDDAGVLTYCDVDQVGEVSEGFLDTQYFQYASYGAGYTNNNGSAVTNYFAIDLLQYVGYDFTITVTFASAESDGTLGVVTSLEGVSSTALDLSDCVTAGTAMTSTGSSDRVKLVVTGGIALANDNGVGGVTNGELYIVWNSTMHIYGVRIELTNPSNVPAEGEGMGELASLVTVDFSTSSGYNSGSGTMKSGTMDDDSEGALAGVYADAEKKYIQYYDYEMDRYGGIVNGAFLTGYDSTWTGETKECDSGWTNYFKIDTSSLVGKYVEITVTFATETAKGYTFADGYIAVTDMLGTPDADSGTATTTEKQTVTLFSGEMTANTMYIVFSTSMAIYSIDISYSD